MCVGWLRLSAALGELLLLGLLLLLLNLLQASLFPLPGVAVVCRNRAERERWEDDHDLVAVPELANHWLAGGCSRRRCQMGENKDETRVRGCRLEFHN